MNEGGNNHFCELEASDSSELYQEADYLSMCDLFYSTFMRGEDPLSNQQHYNAFKLKASEKFSGWLQLSSIV